MRLNAFDQTVVVAAACIAALILGTVLLGDRVGVRIERVSPLGEGARATMPIKIEFSEAMNRDSIGDTLRIVPAIAGEMSWSSSTLIFTPSEPFEPGVSYTVTLTPGARSEANREVIQGVEFSFTIRRPRVAYLSPSDSAPINIWIAEPGVEGSARQLTNSVAGVYNFDVSPDGQYIAYSETSAFSDTEDIRVIDLDTGEIRQVTNCPDSSCTTPIWRPDGQVIAYERVDYNSDLEGVGISPTRLWLIDVTVVPATTTPLFQDTQVLGYDPQWSGDGSRIALYDRGSQGILIYDFRDDSGISIPTRAGTSGSLSPDGTILLYPEVILQDGQESRSVMQMADLVQNTVVVMPGTDETSSDEWVRWSPDGAQVVVSRNYFDERYTLGSQLMLIDPFTGSVTPLTDDPNFDHGFFSWDANGERLVVQRLPLFDPQGNRDNLARPQIWTLNVTTNELVFVADNAFHPRWVP
ncbi:MAG: Ig-like domain-containing protein [Chloroflexota bacterium]|nr:Ig-like domain-containing protein [Chloroflexota bacterium]